jgi:hypothetical protein
MKGMVFRSFERFVEAEWPGVLADEMMSLPALPSGGAYTNVGYYPHSELLTMVIYVGETTQTPVPNLVNRFGQALFSDLAAAHPDMVASYESPIDLLAEIESVIHVDVRKLYQNTELPRFDVIERDAGRSIKLDYSSGRPFADLAEGLMWGCLDHYGVKENASVLREDVKSDGTHSIFTVQVGHDDGALQSG